MTLSARVVEHRRPVAHDLAVADEVLDPRPAFVREFAALLPPENLMVRRTDAPLAEVLELTRVEVEVEILEVGRRSPGFHVSVADLVDPAHGSSLLDELDLRCEERDGARLVARHDRRSELLDDRDVLGAHDASLVLRAGRIASAVGLSSRDPDAIFGRVETFPIAGRSAQRPQKGTSPQRI